MDWISEIKSLEVRQLQIRSTSLQNICSRSAFLRPHFTACQLLWLGAGAAHTAAHVPHLHLPTLKKLPVVCYLELSSPLICFFPFDRKQRISWPAAGAHLQPLVHSYPRKPELVLIVNYSSCYTSATLTHRCPTFHPPSSRMGSSASRVQWCGRTLELQKLLGFGAEAWISSHYLLPPNHPLTLTLLVFSS